MIGNQFPKNDIFFVWNKELDVFWIIGFQYDGSFNITNTKYNNQKLEWNEKMAWIENIINSCGS